MPEVPIIGGSVVNSGAAEASSGGIAITGIGVVNKNTVHLPPEAIRAPEQVDAPVEIDKLHHLTDHFVGRKSDLAQLDEALRTPGVALVQAVHGLGGVGKSALAAYWAARRAHGCRPVRWIDADGPAGVRQGLAELASALQPALGAVLPAEQLAEYALQWLASHTGWLLILDNVNDPADIAPLLTRAPGGRFLITSRLAGVWPSATTQIHLDILSPGESLTLLTHITTVNGPRDLDGAAELCKELGYLPLAVEQAAAFLSQNQLCIPRTYLELLADDPGTMYAQGRATTPDERTIARIWRITLDQLHSKHPLTTTLLRMVAWFAPDRIPIALLEGRGRPAQLHTAVGLLAAYGMVTLDSATNTLSVHRLVQSLARTPDETDPHRTAELVEQAYRDAFDQLFDADPDDPHNPLTWPTWRGLFPHVRALVDRSPTEGGVLGLAFLLTDHGIALIGQGLSHRAVPLLEAALDRARRILDSDHPDVHYIGNQLGAAYVETGDYNRAVELLEKIHEEQVGDADPGVSRAFETRSYLSAAYRRTGAHQQAILLLVQALEEAEIVLPPDDADLHGIRNDLVVAYQEVGSGDKAIALLRDTLEQLGTSYGDDDPATLTTRNDLAVAYLTAGNHHTALPLLQSVADRRKRVLGPDHPDTLSTMRSLAAAHQVAGEPHEAVLRLRQALDGLERTLGVDHPDTLQVCYDLAVNYRRVGEHEQEIRLLKAVLDGREDILGRDHPDTLATCRELGCAELAAGQPDLAAWEFRDALDGFTRTFGRRHIETIRTRSLLGEAYLGTGEFTNAVRLMQETVTDLEQNSEVDNSEVMSARNNLANAHVLAGHFAKAVCLYEETLDGLGRYFGPDHPDVQIIRVNLAYAVQLAENGSD